MTPTKMNCTHSDEGWCLKCVDKLGAENDRLRTALKVIQGFMQRPASNIRYMQIAEPARRCLNVIKQALS